MLVVQGGQAQPSLRHRVTRNGVDNILTGKQGCQLATMTRS